ncbi:MAG: pre-peptidase C-terminal domain-containing protein [Acidobacteriia bacterium]|nr:pre-peptidase C-terminal domain-containing protein [Terriglobia bacterium]
MNIKYRFLHLGPGARGGGWDRGVIWPMVAFVCISLFVGAIPLHAEWHAVFPQFTGGGGWSSDLFITNQGTGAVSNITLSFFTDEGSPLSVETNLGTGPSFTFNLNPGATQTIRVPSTGSLKVGYVLLHAPNLACLRGSEVFRYAQGNSVVTEMGVAQQYPFIHFSFPAEVNSARGINTGLAFANPTFDSPPTTGQKVVVNLVRNDGTLQDTAVVSLAAAGHLAQFLNESKLFPGLDNFSGTVSVSASTRIGLVALRLDQSVYGTVSVDEGPVLAPFYLSQGPISESEPNDSTGMALFLSGPNVVTGSIGGQGDVDYFKFTGRQGDVVTALLDTQSGSSNLDSVLRLEKADGTIVTENDQNGLMWQNDSFLQAVLPTDGTYYLRVSDYWGDGGSNYSYRLHVRAPTSSPPPSQPQITGVDPNSGSRGGAISLTIFGSNLANPSAINFSPSDGISISNLQSTSTQVTALMTISSGATLGNRQVSVTTSAGTSNTLTFSITDPGGSSKDGNWSGNTGQGKSITFTVSNNRISSLSFGGSVSSGGCSGDFTVTMSTMSVAISGNSFSVNSPSSAPYAISFTLSGTFSSNSNASGTTNFTMNGGVGFPPCGSASTTWSATKN